MTIDELAVFLEDTEVDYTQLVDIIEKEKMNLTIEDIIIELHKLNLKPCNQCNHWYWTFDECQECKFIENQAYD
jgi:hypothetical protein